MAALSWRHIEIFHAVMTSRSATEAAKLLHTSQPTVSRELARLEKQLGLSLFMRRQGRLQPTAQALALFEEVQRAYYGLDRILATAQNLRHFSQGEIAIACLPAFSQALLPALCQPFMQRYPAVTFSVIPQESPVLEEWLAAQRYDFGLTETALAPAGTDQHTLLTLNEVCVLPVDHPAADKPCLTPADFADQPFISLSGQDQYRRTLDALFEQAGVARRLVMETHSAASVCAMVRAGIGVSIVNPLSALEYAATGGIRVRRFSVDVPFTVSLIRPRHRPASPLCDHFFTHLCAAAREFPARLAALLGE